MAFMKKLGTLLWLISLQPVSEKILMGLEDNGGTTPIIPDNAPQETNLQSIRNIQNIWAYLCLARLVTYFLSTADFSVLMAGIGLHLSERKWRPKSKPFIKRVNPAILLLPMLLIVVSYIVTFQLISASFLVDIPLLFGHTDHLLMEQ